MGPHRHRAAIDAVASGRPDLVLLDLGLPDIDGLDVCRRSTDADPTIPIVMLTARDEELDIVVGLDAGAIDYVTKPFKLAELLARVRAQLRRSTPGPRPFERRRPRDRRRGPARLAGSTTSSMLRAKEFDLLARLSPRPATR